MKVNNNITNIYLISLFAILFTSASCSYINIIKDVKDEEFDFDLKLLNITEHTFYYDEKDLTTGFTFAFIESFILILTTEIADKSFVLLVFFSMKCNRWIIFFTASVFLCLMNLLAVLLGSSIPVLFYPNFIEWLAVVLFILYSIKLIETGLGLEKLTIYDIYFKSEDKSSKVVITGQLTLRRTFTVDTPLPDLELKQSQQTPLLIKEEEDSDSVGVHEIFVNDKNEKDDKYEKFDRLGHSYYDNNENISYGKYINSEEAGKFKHVNSDASIVYTSNKNEESVLEIICTLISSLLITECGDRSQVATIIISSVYDFWGVLMGTTLSTIICIGVAIFFGIAFSKIITEKSKSYVEAFLFLIFAIQIFVLKMEYIKI